MRPSQHLMVKFGAVCIAMLVTIGLSAIQAPAHADMFKIDGMDVDELGENASAAKAAAVSDAQARGLPLLLQRLTATADHGRLPDTTSLNTDSFVRAVNFSNERLSATRYVATIDVAYQQERVLELLRTAEIAHVPIQRPDILVIPAVSGADGLVLADRRDPWLRVWRLIANSGGMVGWQMMDATSENASKLAQFNADRDVTALTSGYDAQEVVLAVREDDATTGIRYRITPVQGIDLNRSGLLIGENPAMQAASLKRVLDESTARLAADWKARNLVRADKVSQLLIEVLIEDFANWVQINTDLQRLTLVRQVDVHEFARQYAKMTIDFVGERNDLDAALRARGYVLMQEENTWLLRQADGLTGQGNG